MADLILRDLSKSQLASVTAALSGAGLDFETTETYFTPEEAAILLNDLAARQRNLLAQVAEWDGVLPSSEVRDDGGGLRGLTGPITTAVKRLDRAGKIREGLTSPIDTVYDPNNRAYQRTRAFKMDSGNVSAFQAALRGSDPVQ